MRFSGSVYTAAVQCTDAGVCVCVCVGGWVCVSVVYALVFRCFKLRACAFAAVCIQQQYNAQTQVCVCVSVVFAVVFFI
jgi:hypothetical protein